jgi:hypothetical protein
MVSYDYSLWPLSNLAGSKVSYDYGLWPLSNLAGSVVSNDYGLWLLSNLAGSVVSYDYGLWPLSNLAGSVVSRHSPRIHKQHSLTVHNIDHYVNYTNNMLNACQNHILMR